MKKIVSLIIFTVALFWTWNIIHSSSAIGFETHSSIQEKLAELIKQTVLTKKPHIQNFRILRLWTEAQSETKIRAVFAYQFTEEVEGGDSTDQTVEGEAILFREPPTENDQDRWTLQSVKTTNDIVTFSEGLVVTPGAEDAEENSEMTESAPAAETTSPNVSPSVNPTPTPTSSPAAE